MRVEIPYGKEKIPVEFPERARVIHPNEVAPQDESKILKEALANPINSKVFADFISGAKNPLFIVNDGTRPTPTAKILAELYPVIKGLKKYKFIIATGVHRAPTEEELQFIFGSHLEEFRPHIHIHDSRKSEEMVGIGRSQAGTEMEVNRLGVEADRIIIIGSVEPHYFGGFTGGRKSFLPGIASYKTISQNHFHALKPEAKALALEGNPVHEDMIDALKTIEDKPIFSIQTVLDGKRRIYGITAGHIHDSFYAAIDKAKEVFCVEVGEKADIVVTVAPYPMDVDLYQSQKALDNAKLALKEGGIMILVSKCRTGIGEPTFFELLSGSETPQGALDRIKEGFKLGYHKAAKMAEIATWAEMWAVTDLNPEDLKKVFITPFDSIPKALDEAIKRKGDDIIVLMDGSITVPIVEEQ
ncbi:nickel-dependent lactate racemase [candidate division WOR-3 bacterium]|uniref:Nickel-dependent lactate racemase n=1 Tax=candidate division WOR-3 bacterium TaxID=2052148 RepID=A0A660SK35_UNCW3|nr:MAG: nickel-dependent lactate racemase [candidate division WOR-3 bacterium]